MNLPGRGSRGLLAVLVMMTAGAACERTRHDFMPTAWGGVRHTPNLELKLKGVTLAVINARIWTGDAAKPWAEALAASGETIALVGTTEEIRPIRASRTIDAHGRLIVPGFIDSHIHFLDDGADLADAMQYAARQGVTSVHHMGTWEDLDVFERARNAKTLTTRIYAAVPLATWARLRDTIAEKRFPGPDGRGDDWLHIGALTGVVDGSLDDLYSWTSNADKAHLHVVVDAIGDHTNHEMSNIFERIARENGPRDRRFRIEHSDSSVAPPTPLDGIFDAVTRQTAPEQKISVEQALRAYTVDAAYAEFMEQRKGQIARGFLADFVMIDRDLFTIPAAEIREAHVVLTVAGGRVLVEQ
jgi:predicted amidohydrolase YtcJ